VKGGKAGRRSGCARASRNKPSLARACGGSRRPNAHQPSSLPLSPSLLSSLSLLPPLSLSLFLPPSRPVPRFFLRCKSSTLVAELRSSTWAPARNSKRAVTGLVVLNDWSRLVGADDFCEYRELANA